MTFLMGSLPDFLCGSGSDSVSLDSDELVLSVEGSMKSLEAARKVGVVVWLLFFLLCASTNEDKREFLANEDRTTTSSMFVGCLHFLVAMNSINLSAHCSIALERYGNLMVCAINMKVGFVEPIAHSSTENGLGIPLAGGRRITRDGK